MKKLITIVPFLALAAGCAVQSEPTDEPASSNGVDAARKTDRAIVTLGPGFNVAWSETSYPYAARKIAACGSGELWALNENKTLWVSDNRGVSWTYVTTPSSAADIVCDADNLYIFDTNKQIYGSPISTGLYTEGGAPPFIGWFASGLPSQASYVYGGPFAFWAFNTNGGVYYSSTEQTQVGVSVSYTFLGYKETAVLAGGNSDWVYSLTASSAITADSAARLTATAALWGNTWLSGDIRTYLLYDGTLEYNDGFVPAADRQTVLAPAGATAAPANGWNNMPTQPPSALVEIAAASNLIYGLDATYHLWQGTVTETNCFDKVDNDNNGVADEWESSCLQAVAAQYCATAANGFYCSYQFSDNPNFQVTCTGNQATGVTAAGELCGGG